MAKSVIFLFLVFVTLKSQAQNYYISFTASGGSSSVSTVKVDNLTSGASVTLNGGDVLHLVPFTGTDKLNSSAGYIQIYPNPLMEQSLLTFLAPVSDKVSISVIDLNGRTVYRTSNTISTGTSNFRISGIPQGLYIVKVAAGSYQYSAKLLSQNPGEYNARIEYISAVKTSVSQLKQSESNVDMPYKTGDRLLYKGISGIYSTIVPDIPVSSKTINFSFVACSDKDGNNYTTVQIGTQLWMGENLKTTKYRNGDPIPNVSDSVQWRNLTTGAYCNYKNEPANVATYGRLYNWYSIKDSRNACPPGWHIPNDTEWMTLTTYLGTAVAGTKLKENGTAHWQPVNTGTNETGFTALPGGRRDYNAAWVFINSWGYWWSSTEYSTDNAYYVYLGYGRPDVSKSYTNKSLVGYSVRCMHD